MSWRRLLANLGKSMVVLGLLILGFVAYELWGTGLHTARAQDDLESRYFDRLAELEATVDVEVADADDGASTTVTPAEDVPVADPFLDPAVLAALSELPPPEPGDPIGRIEIPAIGIDWWMVEGTNLSFLRDGPGHFSETPMPGQPGNAALAGHRTTYGAPFHNIDRLVPGDQILVSTVQGKFEYEVLGIPVVDGEVRWRPPPVTIDLGGGDAVVDEAAQPAGTGELAQASEPSVEDPVPEAVVGHFIVSPDAGEILGDYGDDRLTLMACHPKYSARERIVVSARLVGPAAPPTARPPTTTPPGDAGDDGTVLPAPDDADLLEGGDPSARTPLLLWGLAALLVVVAAHQVGRRWRRWPTYVAATPLFLATLWSFYANLDRLLPAAL